MIKLIIFTMFFSLGVKAADMVCSKVLIVSDQTSKPTIMRCENNEVVCYKINSKVQCKFKGVK